MIKDPETLYEEIVELITKTRDLRAHSENYREQLREARQAVARNEAILDRVLAQNHGSTSSRISSSPEGS